MAVEWTWLVLTYIFMFSGSLPLFIIIIIIVFKKAWMSFVGWICSASESSIYILCILRFFVSETKNLPSSSLLVLKLSL